jgi:biotin synthase
MKDLIDHLRMHGTLDDDGLIRLIECNDDVAANYLRAQAREVALARFGNKIYMRGLIEFSSYCKNNCYYCGIRAGNTSAERYRLTRKEILECCKTGHALGFRTFVLQGGEDPHFSDEEMTALVAEIKGKYPDCAITLSFGEKSREAYRAYKDAGADRYLLRHETADAGHYKKLHPAALSLDNRKKCLYILKELGFQVGTGFMVGSPCQTSQTLLKDLRFIEELKPQMLGIGPFIPHKDTPFAGFPAGSKGLTLRLLAMLRLMRPNTLIPATTALGTIDDLGREEGILSGANVVMPNLSPTEVRSKYLLYNDKIATGEKASESKRLLEKRVKSIGYELFVGRGDFVEKQPFRSQS